MQLPTQTIIPAIMPTGYGDLVTKVNEVAGLVTTVQLDIMDGVFVPARTWPFMHKSDHDDAAGDAAYWQAIQAGNAGLPMLDTVEYELDLMVQYADTRLEEWLALQPARIVFHLESVQDMDSLLKRLEPVREIVEVGISFDDEGNVESLAQQWLPHFDFVQVMGIDDIGAQGQPFSERALYNLRALRQHGASTPVSVDGAVNRETIDRLAEAGADRFVVGSAVFADGNIRENIMRLDELAATGSQP